MDILKEFIRNLSNRDYRHLENLRMCKEQEICISTCEELKRIFKDRSVSLGYRETCIEVVFETALTKDELVKLGSLISLEHFSDLQINLNGWDYRGRVKLFVIPDDSVSHSVNLAYFNEKSSEQWVVGDTDIYP